MNVSSIPLLRSNTMPTMEAIQQIPRAATGEFDLSDKEARTLRSRIYSLNKNNAAGRRWRTLRDGTLLIVWRIS